MNTRSGYRKTPVIEQIHGGKKSAVKPVDNDARAIGVIHLVPPAEIDGERMLIVDETTGRVRQVIVTTLSEMSLEQFESDTKKSNATAELHRQMGYRVVRIKKGAGL